jgi:hypothetical protein
MANNQEETIQWQPAVNPDSILNPITFAWWYNFQINQRHKADSQQTALTAWLSRIPQNELYRDQLQLATALRWYYSGDIKQAFQMVRDLEFRDSGKAGLYNDILGQWSLQNQQPTLALEYFTQSINAGYLPALKHQVLTLLDLGRVKDAARSWNTFRYRSGDSLSTDMSELVSFISLDQADWGDFTDREKVWYLRFRAEDLSTKEKLSLLSDIENTDLYHQAAMELWDQALSSQSTKIQEELLLQVNHPSHQLQWAVMSEDYVALEQLIPDLEILRLPTEPWILLGQAMRYQQHGDAEKASQCFHQLTKNPFFEPGILRASSYFEDISEDEYAAYNVLLDALAINPYSVNLLKAYGVSCTKLNLDTYTLTTLETLRELIPEKELSSFQRELEQIEDRINSEFADPPSASEI